MPNPAVIFANPNAGRGRAVAIATELERALAGASYAVKIFFDHPAKIPADKLPTDIAAAITIGGDGTLRTAAEMLLSLGNNMPPMLPIPLGTANLMGKHLGITWPANQLSRAVVETVKQNKIVRLDAGQMNGRLFLLMVGIGLDAQVVHVLEKFRKGPIDFTTYALPAALSFAQYSFPPITVTIDGRTRFNSRPGIAFIGNIPEYGTGFPILNRAIADDGLLDVCVLPCENRRDLANLLLNVGVGEHDLRDDVIYTKAKEIHITSEEKVPAQLDGDAAGFTPIHISVKPQSVPFLVPA